MRTTPEIENLVTQVLARDIAAGVELARSLGYVMPTDFTIGIKFMFAGSRTRVRMRLDDVTHDSFVMLPDLNGRQSLPETDRLWKAAWERLHVDALTVAQVWIDHHPTALKDGVHALAILDAMKADDDLHAKWMASCRERAKSFQYRTVR